MILPTGKGWFIWILGDCEGGDPNSIAAAAQAAGVSHVLIKISNGTMAYNGDIGPVVKALQAVGISVWGWSYFYGISPVNEASVAVTRTLKYNLSGLVVNAEVEFKAPGMAAVARSLMTNLRGGLGAAVPIGLSSYRYPSLHKEFPWLEFLQLVDFVMPQVYWMGATNAGMQLRRSVDEFKGMPIVRPIIPTGAAFKEHGWAAQPAEVLDFLQTAERLSFEGINFWEWGRTRRDLPTNWDVIAQYPWAGSPPTTEPPTTETTRIVALVDGQNIRSEPFTWQGSKTVIGQLCKGQALTGLCDIRIRSAGEVWCHFEVGWVAAIHNGRQYLKTVE
jgi:hypothetical protein